MRAKIRKIKGVFPVTVTGAVYYDGTNKTISEMIDNGEMGGSLNTRDPEDGEIFEIEEVDLYGQIIASVSNLELNEGTSKTFNIKLSGAPTNDQVVNIVSDNPKITVNPTSITFNSLNYNVDQVVTVTGAKNDTEADYTGKLTLSSNTVPSVEVGITVKNVAETVYGGIVLSTASLTINELEQDKFTVKLDKAPTNDQVVSFKFSTDKLAELDKMSLTFTPANYNTPQEVTITCLEDSNGGDGLLRITASSPNVADSSLVVTIKDINTSVPIDTKISGAMLDMGTLMSGNISQLLINIELETS